MASFGTCAILAVCILSSASGAEPVTEVRVRLESARAPLEITGRDLRISPPSSFFVVEPLSGRHQISITRSSAGDWWVQTDDPSHPAQHWRSNRLWLRGGEIVKDGHTLTDNFEIKPAEGDSTKFDLIARLDLEDYLLGVLPAEMPASWPLSALKAQTVAARSFVLKQMRSRRDGNFDVESTISDQMYSSPSRDELNSVWHERVRTAVQGTQGEVLSDPSGRIIKAFYSADCGCQSEDPRFVWGKVRALSSVHDPTCGRLKPTQWKLALSRREVRAKLVRAKLLEPQQSLATIQVVGRTPSGRVSNLWLLISQGASGVRRLSLTAQRFRQLFGFQNVRSADFSLRWLGDELVIHGVGEGHGVGLCQRGARMLAEEGLDYSAILKIYYPQGHVVRWRERSGNTATASTQPR